MHSLLFIITLGTRNEGNVHEVKDCKVVGKMQHKKQEKVQQRVTVLLTWMKVSR